ncbi:MAG: hypothetical protein HY222_02430 [Thaumarchaeota archaeon]|nr:hypothetical protein [Nitrososphaerota archaeon]MBI3641231.1 hypothetical protein [Nitrososphaerota archaeon]
MSSKLMLALFVTAVLMTSIAAVTIPAASALTSRSSFNDNHYTALYSGGPKICGDHKCAPGEYDKMQQALAQAQMKGKTGSTAPSTPTPPITTPTPPTTMPAMNETSTTMPAMNETSTMPAMSVCDSVKATLTTAGISSTVMAKVMADLSCS